MHNAEAEWKEYRDAELARATSVLTALGFTLDAEQPHIQGERFLMHALTTKSGRKLILRGSHARGRVIIKVTSDPDGKRELRHERECRRVLDEIRFAYGIFRSPEEILFSESNGLTISVTLFIDQEQAFLDRAVEEQFALTLAAFKAQESAHATTYEHYRLVEGTFGSIDADGYIRSLRGFITSIRTHALDTRTEMFTAVEQQFTENRDRIEQYCGFLTHVDFVPHNFRIHDGNMYLLDHSSLRFGNKHEGWARFLNFMTLHNPALEHALTWYVEHNRSPEEWESLALMRLYRLTELICFYASLLSKTEGDLHRLTKTRVHFWSDVLAARLENRDVDASIINAYRDTRDALRSPEEKRRQIGLH